MARQIVSNLEGRLVVTARSCRSWLVRSRDRRINLDAIRSLLIDGHDGTESPLSQLAEITQAFGPAAIRREAGRRGIAVEGTVTGRDLGSVLPACSRMAASSPLRRSCVAKRTENKDLRLRAAWADPIRWTVLSEGNSMPSPMADTPCAATIRSAG